MLFVEIKHTRSVSCSELQCSSVFSSTLQLNTKKLFMMQCQLLYNQPWWMWWSRKGMTMVLFIYNNNNLNINMSYSCSSELHWVQFWEFSGWFVDSLVSTVWKNAEGDEIGARCEFHSFSNKQNDLNELQDLLITSLSLRWHFQMSCFVWDQPLGTLCATCITNKNIKFCGFKNHWNDNSAIKITAAQLCVAHWIN